MFRWIITILVIVLLPVAAAAQGAGPTFDGKIAEGHALYLAGDFEGAIAKYEEAKDVEPGRGDTYYFIACALSKVEGKTGEAVSVFKTAATIAGSKDENLHGKALFAAAAVLEASGDLDAAGTAWNEYLQYANAHAEATVFPAIAQQRIDVIVKKKKLDTEYSAVKEKMTKSATVASAEGS